MDGFKDINGITFQTVCGESGSVNQEVARAWKDHVAQMIKEKPAKDIFNVKETGLFFKCTPDKTLVFKVNCCSGGKNSKERVTMLVGANMNGTEKLPLLMIGKSKNPRCFKSVKLKSLEYRANKNLDDFTIILIIDNCTAHNTVPLIQNVKVILFPPNMTSVVQLKD